MIKQENTYYCDFCAKSQHEVRKIVADLDAIGICDECVTMAAKICEYEHPKPVAEDFEVVKDALRDAARYRALRAVPIQEMSHVRVVVALGGRLKPTIATAEVIDAAVDLLIARQREKSDGL